MKKYFSHLSPMERRLTVGVLVVVILVLNWWFVWPHFSDWGNYKTRLVNARTTLKQYQAGIDQQGQVEAQVKSLEGQGQFVPLEDQVINFMRVIQAQAAQAGILGGVNYSRATMHTNQFFVEQEQNINVTATDAQLIDFLYQLGSSSSMIRVRDLELQPDPSRTHLTASIRLVASYQKAPLANAKAANETSK